MRLSCAAALVLALANAVGVSTTQAMKDLPEYKLRQAARLSNSAAKAFRTGNLTEARRLYERALEVAPEFPDAHLGLGHLTMRSRQFDRALECYQRARDGYAWMASAILESQLQQYDEAQEQIRELRPRIEELRQRQLRPGSEENGQVAISIQRMEQALAQLEQVRRPTDDLTDAVPAEVDFFIGNALMNLGRHEEAVEAWRIALREDPSLAAAHNNLAVALWKLGRVDDAWAHVERAERLGLAVNPAFKTDLKNHTAASAE